MHIYLFFTTFAEILNHSLIHNKLSRWYEQNHRVLPWRETKDPYRIWVSEVILQQTRVNQGLEYYLRFVERFPNIESLAAAEEKEVLRYWQGLGYYSRARNMHRAAQYVVENRVEVFRLDPSNEEQIRLSSEYIFRSLLAMPGVGEYTAGAIASFAFNLPYPALDGNVYRVLARLYDCDIAFDTTAGKKHFRELANELLDRQHPRLFNSAIMEFGALYCTPTSPDCALCPIQECCLGYLHHTAELLPVRKPRTRLRERYLNYTIYLTSDMRTLLHQRVDNDIWKHLYEFPLVESDSLLPVSDNAPYIDIAHTLSHQRLHARFQLKKVSELPQIPGTFAISLSEIDDYALSRLTLRALEVLAISL